MNNHNYKLIKLDSIKSDEDSTENITENIITDINEKHVSYLRKVNVTDGCLHTAIESLYIKSHHVMLLSKKVKTDLNICGSEFIKDVTLIETETYHKIVVALHNSVLKKPNSIIEFTRDIKAQKTVSKFISNNQEKSLRSVSNNLVKVFKSDNKAMEACVIAILLDFDAIKSDVMPNAHKIFKNYK